MGQTVKSESGAKPANLKAIHPACLCQIFNLIYRSGMNRLLMREDEILDWDFRLELPGLGG